MRLWALAALTLLIAGCSSPAGPDPAASAGDAPRNEAMELGRGSYMLGLPTTGPTDISAGLGFRVPDGFTHLTVTVRITTGSSTGLYTSGVPGCGHAYPDPQVPGDPLVYDCWVQPGDYTLEFRHRGGRIGFDVVIEGDGTPPPAEPLGSAGAGFPL